jgi:thiamine kinase-like enzyme
MDDTGLINSVIKEINANENKEYKLTNFTVLKDWERNRVIRIELNPKNKSLILKLIKQDETCGFNDFASLKFLSGLDLKSEIIPGFYFGSLEEKYFVTEDMQTSINLDTYLKGSYFQSARKYFLKLAKQSANLTILTYNRQKNYEKIRQKLPSSYGYGLTAESKKFSEGMVKAKRLFKELDIALPKEFDREINQINNRYLNPGKFLAFSHGDMAPTNNLIKAGKVYLIDFEYGGYRHMLYDLTAWNILCPLPEDMVTEMKNKYFKQVSKGLNISKTELGEEWHYISAWRGLSMLSWFPMEIFIKNFNWVEEWTMREALLGALKRLMISLNQLANFEIINEPLNKLDNILSEKWGYGNREIIPDWPAFQENA